MTEIKKIVTDHVPVESLPDSVRQGIEAGRKVRVTVETETEAPVQQRALRDFYGAGRGAYASSEDAVEFIRKLRDEWED